MTESLYVPELPDDVDALTAALAYAKAGWYLAPVRPDDRKNPGSRLGKGWPAKTFRDPDSIVSYFAGTSDGLAFHNGRSGAISFDVDHPENLHPLIRRAIDECQPPHQGSRPNQPGRGHYLFRLPAGRMPGNRVPKALDTESGWGEIRGRNGVIIVAPSVHEQPGGHYEWHRTGPLPLLPDYLLELLPDTPEADAAATDEEVEKFLAAHTAAERPDLLGVHVLAFAKAVEAGKSRHNTMIGHSLGAMREAFAGLIDAKLAADTLDSVFCEAAGKSPCSTEQDAPRSLSAAREEFAGMLSWAVAQAAASDPQETLQRIAKEVDKVDWIPDVVTVAGTKEEERSQSMATTVTDTGTKKEERSISGPGLPLRDPAMFHGLLGEIVDAADPHTEGDPVGVLVSLMAGVGALLNQQPHVMIGNTRHPLLIWPILFGQTGSGRKGEASSASRQFLRRASPYFDEISVTGLSSGEGLIERVKDPVETDEEEGGSRRRVEWPGTDDKRLMITEPEFASVMARAKREGNSLAGVLREAWDGGRLGVLTKAHVRASSSHIAIAGHITPKEFRLRLVESDLAGGTYNRFLPVYVERSKRLPLPDPVPEHVLAEMGERLSKSLWRGSKIDRIRLSKPSAGLWSEQLYDEFCGDDEDTPWSEFARRAAPYCLRIGALHACLDGRDEISLDDLGAAASLVRYSMDSAKYILARTTGDGRLDKIVRAIDESRTGFVTKTELSAMFGRNLPAAVIEELLNQVVASGNFKCIEIPTRGRPATAFARSDFVLSSSFVPANETKPKLLSSSFVPANVA